MTLQVQMIKLEAEMADYQSDRTLFPTADRNSNITSSVNGLSPTKTRYNTLGKDGGWSHATEAVTYKFNIEEDEDIIRSVFVEDRIQCVECIPTEDFTLTALFPLP